MIRRARYGYAAIADAVICPCCGTERNTEFCADCGQDKKDYRSSFLGLVASFISETFELDGRLVRTLRALFSEPGFLAQEFSKNKRAAYMSPARLYFFTSVLFFFMLSVLGSTGSSEDEERDEQVQIQIDEAIEAAENEQQQEIEKGEKPVDPNILRPLLNKRQLESLDRILASDDSPEKILAVQGIAKAVEQISAETGEDSAWWLKEFAGKTVVSAEDPQQLRKTFSENVPLAMFVLLPAYALLLKLFFYRWRPKIYYAEHFVFALYLHILAFIIFSLNLLIPEGNWFETPLFAITVMYLGYYSYRAMRKYYARSRMQTAWRFGFLGLGYLLMFIPAFVVVMVYSFISL